MNRSRSILLTLFFTFLTVAVLSGVYYFKEDIAYSADVEEAKAESREFDITNTGNDGGKNQDKNDDPLYRRIDFEKLYSRNKAVWGWVYLPDSIIDFYVMREKNPRSVYYLSHNIDGNFNRKGSVLTYDSPDKHVPNAHQVLYGHKFQRAKVIFTELVKYKDKSYFDSHPYVYIYHKDHSERYRVWGCANVHSSNKVYKLPYQIGSDDYQDMIDTVRDKFIRENSEVSLDNRAKLTVLSTCDRARGSGWRFVVFLVPDAAYYYNEDYVVKATGPEYSLKLPVFEAPDITRVYDDLHEDELPKYKVNDKVFDNYVDAEREVEQIAKEWEETYQRESNYVPKGGFVIE